MSELGVHRERADVAPLLANDRPTGRRRGDRIVGASRATQEVIERAMAAAASELPIRISGPAGSGKEHVARAIHAWGPRAGGPFVVLSCVGVAEALLGRELFGCGASVYPTLPTEHEGALARAAGGTLLVDRVDRLSGDLREGLAKTLAERRFQREGDAGSVPLRTRVVVSSLEPLGGSPFGDLPHLDIRLTPLAERAEDVLPLAAHFLRLFADEEGVAPVGFTADARDALLSEPWPGNARELCERVRQALRLAGGGAISAEALLLASDGDDIPSFKEAKRAFETRYVVGLLRRCRGNISRAARLAKKDRKDFYDVIRRTGIDPADFR
jgi:two-component system, NtrC family, response regulator GlrR